MLLRSSYIQFELDKNFIYEPSSYIQEDAALKKVRSRGLFVRNTFFGLKFT